jgi:hypothetical protein
MGTVSVQVFPGRDSQCRKWDCLSLLYNLEPKHVQRSPFMFPLALGIILYS